MTEIGYSEKVIVKLNIHYKNQDILYAALKDFTFTEIADPDMSTLVLFKIECDGADEIASLYEIVESTI